jgi:hypothetical protein
MLLEFVMGYDDARVVYYAILLIVDRLSSQDDCERLAAIGKECFAFTISYDETPKSISVVIEPRLLKEILQGIKDLWLNVDAAAHLHMNVNATIPGTPYLLRNLGDLMPAMKENSTRIEKILADS